MTTDPHAPALDLPDGWAAHAPDERDVPELHALRARHEQWARGATSARVAEVHTEVAGDGAPTRTHLAVCDATGALRAWASVQDRAAGRVLIAVLVDPELADLDPATTDSLAGGLFGWAAQVAAGVAGERELPVTQLDSGTFADDGRQQRWLAAAGYHRARTWLQMSRPVTADDHRPAAEPGEGVRVRPVRHDAGEMPEESDLKAVHDVLEEAFADHFNHHEETFDEFLDRLRADPGHRWDHWWLGELLHGDRTDPAGALVASATLDARGTAVGSYVEYLGVLRTARGRGLASTLLDTVITDAADRGRTSVGLEVDADSPTGAADLYRSLGFETRYVTQSWHREVTLGEAGAEA